MTEQVHFTTSPGSCPGPFYHYCTPCSWTFYPSTPEVVVSTWDSPPRTDTMSSFWAQFHVSLAESPLDPSHPSHSLLLLLSFVALKTLILSMTHSFTCVSVCYCYLPTNAGDTRDSGSIPETGRCPGEGNSNPVQYSCLGNLMSNLAVYSPWGHKESDMTEPST